MANRPNILLFLPDGMQARPTALEHPCITPNFDRLSRGGVYFTRAYTPLQTCSPARASLMTGLLPHNHGVLQVDHGVDDDQCVLRADRPHWAQRLVRAGYRTGYFGKWHIERTFHLEDFGWQVNGCDRSEAYRQLAAQQAGREEERENLHPPLRWHSGPEGYRDLLHYGVTDLPPEGRQFSVAGRLAGQFIAGVPADQPWCCCVSYSVPNEAMVCSRQTLDRYDVDSIELPASLRDDLSGRPGLYRRAQALWHSVTQRQWKEALACYYARITEVDQQLGLLLAQLEQAGQLDSTIVVVSTDHGKYVGGHGMDAHNFGAFEELYNIPMIVAGPGVARGVKTTARVGLHDLCPTLLELAGAEPFQSPDSRSFAPVLRDPRASEGRFDSGYAEYFGTRFGLTQRIYWQGPWKFIFSGLDCDELYNLHEDPHEMRNLAAEAAFQKQARAMMAGVWSKIRQTGDRTLLNSQYYSMRLGCIGPDAAGE